MKSVTDRRGREFQLEKDIAGGGEARIWTVSNRPDRLAKIYHKPASQNEAKLEAMISNPPQQPATHTAIAWPVDLIYNRGKFAGFFMPNVEGSDLILYFYNPVKRKNLHPNFNCNWRYLLYRTALNLAIAVEAIHFKGHVIGDFNESNILVNEKALVTLIDTDSFQVKDQRGHVYRCPVGKAEYTPPELQGKDFKQIDRAKEHDLFGIAVMIFHLLMEGVHPFTGVLHSKSSVGRVDLHCIKKGIFPYKNRSKADPPPKKAPEFNNLYPDIQKAFVRCFANGHNKPMQRPDANEWKLILEKAENALTDCQHNPDHVYSNHLKHCPWCASQQTKGVSSSGIGQQRPFQAPSSHRPSGQIQPQSGVKQSFILLRWIIACIFGWIPGLFVFEVIENPFINWPAFGFIAGFTQWLVLKKFMQQSYWWIAACSLHWLFFGIMSGKLFEFVKWLSLPQPTIETINWEHSIGLFAVGIVGGFLQWLVIKNKFQKAYMWIIACAIGYAAGITVNDMMFELILNMALKNMGESASWIIIRGIYWAVFASVYGFVTGITLSWLIRQTKP